MADNEEGAAAPRHVLEPAPSGRAKCRACGALIAKGELRFGEKLANPFSGGDMTVWFHPRCAAFKRPELLLQALAAAGSSDTADRAELERFAGESLARPRLQRIDGAERAPTAQARCRHCHEPIARDDWRVRLSFWEEGRFTPGGFVHLRCGPAYFEVEHASSLAEPLLQLGAAADDAARGELRTACRAAAEPGAAA